MKKVIVIVLSCFSLLLCFNGTVQAEENEEESIGKFGYCSTGSDVNDYNVETHYENNWQNLNQLTNYPEFYSLVELNQSTSVKNQGITGSCWAFATIASAESSAIKDGLANADEIDLSEMQMAYYAYNKVDDPLSLTSDDDIDFDDVPDYFDDDDIMSIFDIGGNFYLSAIELANGIGFVDESSFSYNDALNVINNGTAVDSNLAYNSNHYEVDKVIYINPQQVNVVKNMLMNEGAVAVSVNYPIDFNNISLYTPLSDFEEGGPLENAGEPWTNHSVTVVGWDDNYSKTCFSTDVTRQPKNNGAWIVKNSWGDSYNSNGGYFYLSYEDNSLSDVAAVFKLREKVENQNIYQYDGTTVWTIDETLSSSVDFASIHTAHREEELYEVGFFTLDSNMDYQISIYDGLVSSINSTLLAQTSIGHLEYGGYHRIALDSPVRLTQGQRYSIQVTLSNCDGGVFHFFLDTSWDALFTDNYYFVLGHWISRQQYNQTKFRDLARGIYWMDNYLYTSSGSALRLKGYTVLPDIVIDNKTSTLLYNQTYTPSLTINSKDFGITDVAWTYDTSCFSFDNGVFTPLKQGETVLIATLPNGESDCFSVNVKEIFTVDSKGKLTAYQGFGKDIVFDDGITSIGNSVFKNMATLTSADFHNNAIVSIGDEAFMGCTALESLCIPQSVNSLGENSFDGVICSVEVGCVQFSDIQLSIAGIGRALKKHYHLTKHDALAKTCTTAGNIEYFSCDECEKLFNDNTASGEIMLSQTLIEASHEYGKWIEEIPSTCQIHGVAGHYQCADCASCFDILYHQIDSLQLGLNEHEYRDSDYEYNNDATMDFDGTETALCHYGCKTTHTRIKSGSKLILQSIQIKTLPKKTRYTVGSTDFNPDGIIIERYYTNGDSDSFDLGAKLSEILQPGEERDGEIDGFNSAEPGQNEITVTYRGKTCTFCIEIINYMIGDINGDNRITDSDAIYLLMNTFFPDKYPISQPCDFNGDGLITDSDAIYLLMNTFFPDKYPIE